MGKEKREQEKSKPKAKVGNGKGLLPGYMQDPVRQKVLILIGLSLFLSTLIAPSFTVTSPDYEEGDIADRNIKAKRDFLVEDEEATLKKRQEAADEAPAVYDLDERVAQDVRQKLDRAFAFMQKAVNLKSTPQADSMVMLSPDAMTENLVLNIEPAPAYTPDSDQVLQQRKEDFENLLGILVSEEIFKILYERHFDRDLQIKIVQLLDAALEHGVIADMSSLLQASGRNMAIRRIQSQQERVTPPPHYCLDLDEARKFIRAQALELGSDMNEIAVISTLAIHFLQPNLTFNLSETERRKTEQAEQVKPVYIQIKKNEMLVREGQRIGPEELLRLKAHKDRKSTAHHFLLFLVMFLFITVCLWVLARVSRQHIPSFRTDIRDLVFLTILMALLLLMGRFTIWITDTIGESSVLMGSKALIYAIPLTAGAMLVSILFDVTLSLIFSLTMSIFAAMLFGRDFGLFLYFIIGSLVAAHSATPCKNRMTPIRAGLLVGCTNIALVVFLGLIDEQPGVLRIMINSLAGFCGGVSAGILTTGLTPLTEIAFGYTTDIKLLELATMDQPLLQELMVQAPGTYHHSIIVGNMVESAAKSIGANSLLAKVAAYYHDIGKIKKPLYFIENQLECDNRHEKLAPSMSSLILISHVKEGIELARQNHLGKPLIDIIQQHHGTSLISFFYKKALDAREKAQNSKGAELPPINIEDYRYPGPKPQTKEAGLVMLADVVEAACRSLANPTPARIKGLVNKLINNVFIDGQLEECELTLKDFHHIAKHFNQILATVHHKRVEYPSLAAVEGKGKADASSSSQRESKADRDRSSANQEDSQKDLKRLGLQ